jgi:hypothetical protein
VLLIEDLTELILGEDSDERPAIRWCGPRCFLSGPSGSKVELERFPFEVRDGIRFLFGDTPETVRARSDEEQVRLRSDKLRTIRFIEDYLISRAAASAAIAMIFKRQTPLCLFLRSFSMGHRVLKSAVPDPWGRLHQGEWLAVGEPVGGRLLRHLADALQGRTTIVAIANPAEWLPHRLVPGPFVNVVLDDDEWQGVVDPLIKASQMIVVHRAGSSPGVDHELQAIRSAGRVGTTIVVREPEIAGEPDSDPDVWPLIDMLDRRQRLEEARQKAMAGGAVFPPDPELDGFTVIEWRDDSLLPRALAQAIGQLHEESDADRTFGRVPNIEPSEAPPEELAKYRVDASGAYELAARCMRAGDLRMQEELLFECFATSCAADDVGGRASACLELGRLFLRQLGDPGAAAVPLEYASGHFMILGVRDYALQALHLYAVTAAMSGDVDAARDILAQTKRWEPTEDIAEWQRQLWGDVESQATDPRVAELARLLSSR